MPDSRMVPLSERRVRGKRTSSGASRTGKEGQVEQESAMKRTRISGWRVAQKSGDEGYPSSSIVVYDARDTICNRLCKNYQ
jgi:hypothetical protein